MQLCHCIVVVGISVRPL